MQCWDCVKLNNGHLPISNEFTQTKGNRQAAVTAAAVIYLEKVGMQIWRVLQRAALYGLRLSHRAGNSSTCIYVPARIHIIFNQNTLCYYIYSGNFRGLLLRSPSLPLLCILMDSLCYYRRILNSARFFLRDFN